MILDLIRKQPLVVFVLVVAIIDIVIHLTDGGC